MTGRVDVAAMGDDGIMARFVRVSRSVPVLPSENLKESHINSAVNESSPRSGEPGARCTCTGEGERAEEKERHKRDAEMGARTGHAHVPSAGAACVSCTCRTRNAAGQRSWAVRPERVGAGGRSGGHTRRAAPRTLPPSPLSPTTPPNHTITPVSHRHRPVHTRCPLRAGTQRMRVWAQPRRRAPRAPPGR